MICFQCCPICICAEDIISDLFLDNCGFLSSIACPISMNKNLDFFLKTFCCCWKFLMFCNIPHYCHFLKYLWLCAKIFTLWCTIRELQQVGHFSKIPSMQLTQYRQLVQQTNKCKHLSHDGAYPCPKPSFFSPYWATWCPIDVFTRSLSLSFFLLCQPAHYPFKLTSKSKFPWCHWNQPDWHGSCPREIRLAAFWTLLRVLATRSFSKKLWVGFE